MSKLVLSGDTSGSVTLDAPAVSGTTTLTLPTTTSTLAINGPAFSAFAGSATTIPNNVTTKVLFNTEEYDTNNNFASSTFTPTIAGYYFINSTINTSIYISGNARLFIFKNGSTFKSGVQSGNSGNQAGLSVSALIYMNGTTDYLEIYAYQAVGSSANAVAASDVTYFQGYLARSA